MNNMANIHYQNRRYAEAEDFYRDSIRMARREIQLFIEFEKKQKEKMEVANSRMKKLKNKIQKKKKKPTISIDTIDKTRWQLEQQLTNREYLLAKCLIN